jgi:conjugal transfer pilus assembly protein TraF
MTEGAMSALPRRTGRGTRTTLLLAALSANTLAAPQSSFYERGSEGWFWYRDPKEQAPVPTPKAPEQPKPTEQPAPTAELPPAREPGPEPLSAKWFRKNLDAYRDRAIDDPTPENVAAYLYLQRIAMDKSSRFAKVSERVVQGDPFLDEITQRPTATFAANLVNKTAGAQRDALLEKIAGRVSLWFFFRSDCPYCEAQAPLLARLSQMYGFDILPVSVDGLPLSSGLFTDHVQDAGQANALGVRSTPAMFLVDPATATFVPLAQGLLSVAQLQDRIIEGAVKTGWVSETEAALTKAVVTENALDASGLTGALPDDPAELLARLRGLAQ